MIFFEHRIDKCNENEIEFEALVDGNSSGKCILILRDNIAEITEISYENNKPYILDGLVRAAFNFAANRNYYIGLCSAKGIDEHLIKMNFNKTEAGYSNDIPSILMGSCKNCIN